MVNSNQEMKQLSSNASISYLRSIIERIGCLYTQYTGPQHNNKNTGQQKTTGYSSKHSHTEFIALLARFRLKLQNQYQYHNLSTQQCAVAEDVFQEDQTSHTIEFVDTQPPRSHRDP